MTSTIKLLSAHRSIRKFKDKPVHESILQTIVMAGQCASTSNHIQAYTLIRVKNTENRRQIAELAGPQPWVEKAPVFLVFCADLVRVKAACEKHGRSMTSGWVEQFIVATVDTALMAQNMMVAAESLGLGGVFIGGIRNDPDRVCRLLKIPDNAYPVFGMCLGYPDHAPDIKPRLPIDLVLKEDTFEGSKCENETISRMDVYDRITKEYYSSRDSNLRDQTWTLQMAEFVSQAHRPHMKLFLEKKRLLTK